MEKNLLGLIPAFLLICLTLNPKSQNCEGDEKKWDFVPKELYRVRLQNFGRYVMATHTPCLQRRIILIWVREVF